MNRYRWRTFVLELDGAWAIDEGEVIVEEFDVGDVDGHAHAVSASFWRCVADGGASLDATRPDHTPRTGEDGLEKSSLAGEVRAD